MKTTSALYKELRQQDGSWYEVEVTQGSKTYGLGKAKSVKIFPTLIADTKKAPSPGGVCATQCELLLKEASDNWPRMAEFSVRVRLNSEDGTQQSEWLDLGTYYTDERYNDTFGNLHITAYDGMLFTEQYWTDKVPSELLPTTWPITSKAFCDMLEAAGLIEIDSRTVLDDTVAFIGLDTTSTIRDKLKDIATVHGGNWHVTTEGKFRLVPFANMVDGSAAIAGIAIAGVSVVGDETRSIDDGADYAFLGMAVKTFNSSPALQPVSAVALESPDGTVASAGTLTGYTLKGDCDFASTHGIAELCLANTRGHIYKPFEATGAVLDPAAEVGDLVIINGKSYQMMSIEWNLGQHPRAKISAPFEQEVDHEFTIISREAKTYRKSLKATEEKLTNYPTILAMSTAIDQSAQSVLIQASQTYVAIPDYTQAIENLQNQIDGRISTYSGAVVPTLSNYPASEWTTQSAKEQHVGALYLVTSDEGAAEAGQYYRFEQNGDAFAWVLVEDSALATALANAAAAQESANQAIANAASARQAADAAQGTADEAKADAIAKAAEAQAVAIAQAAVDATSKANQALAEAQAYSTLQLSNFIEGDFADTINNVQSQLDQKIETYYQAADPSLSWSENDHTGDLWYSTENQLYYRWNGAAWEELTSNPPTAVFDRIDGKANVFISQPVPPYAVGDIWTQGATGDILKCDVARAEGESYNPSDWSLASKYTDDSALGQFMRGEFAETIESLKKQLDGKAETYYQAEDPSDGGRKWNAVTGKAIVGITVAGSTLDIHEGDMWYRTTDNKTFRWNGTAWEQQEIPDDVFDVIDGKAQVFVSQPTTPYYVGDLWFNSASDGILTCVADRESGSFNSADWAVRNKYTDDTKANSVQNDLNAYKETVTSEFEVANAAINARVTKTGGENKARSFSWSLDETGHYWYANGDQSPIVQITASGLKVRGEVNATSGYIGNGSYGFTIGPTSISNGMTGFWDEDHNGVFVGTDGISLGGGKFRVDSEGNLYANTGTFTGSVYASNIQYGSTGGYLSGNGISGAGNFDTGYLSGGVGTSLGYANFSNAVFNAQDTAPFVNVTTLTGTNIRGTNLLAWSSTGGSYKNIREHTHLFDVDDDGYIHIRRADWDGGDHPFNMADTHFYQEAVSAAREEGARTVTITSLTASRPTYDESSKTYTIPLSAGASNGATRTSSTTINASTVYNNGYSAGVTAGRNGVTISSVTGSPDSKTYNERYNTYTIPISAEASNGAAGVGTVVISASEAYNAGREAGELDVTISSVYGNSDGKVYNNRYNTYTIPLGATASNGESGSGSVTISASEAYGSGYSRGQGDGYTEGYNAGYDDGIAAGGGTITKEVSYIQYDSRYGSRSLVRAVYTDGTTTGWMWSESTS